MLYSIRLSHYQKHMEHFGVEVKLWTFMQEIPISNQFIHFELFKHVFKLHLVTSNRRMTGDDELYSNLPWPILRHYSRM
jgi:hypothetical protein